MRSNHYDALKTSIQKLRTLKQHQDDILIKAQDGSLEEYCEDIGGMDEISKSIADQFETLRTDHYAGRINRAFYQDHLKSIKEFLDENPDFKVRSFPFKTVEKEIVKFW